MVSFFLLLSLFFAQPEGWKDISPLDEQVIHLSQDEGVLFSKKVGAQRIFIHFPEEPSYQRRGDHVELECAHEGITYFLVMSPERSYLPLFEGAKGLHQKEKEGILYVWGTKGSVSFSEKERTFCASLRIESLRKSSL